MTVGLLLAAGRATRFGSQKLLAPLPDGRLVAAASAAQLCAVVSRVVAVTRPDEALMATLSKAGCEVVVNARADEGMGTSIACGVAATAEAHGWLIALADMPFVQSPTIGLVAGHLRSLGGIVIPTYQGQRGHPVGFAADFGAELQQLQGDQGARSVLAKHRARLHLLAVEDAGVIADIDVPADLGL